MTKQELIDILEASDLPYNTPVVVDLQTIMKDYPQPIYSIHNKQLDDLSNAIVIEV